MTSPVNGSFFPMPASSPLALGPHPPTDLGPSYPVVPYPSSPQTFFPTSNPNNSFISSAIRGSPQNHMSDFGGGGGSFSSGSGDFFGAPNLGGSIDSNRSPSRESRGSQDGSGSGRGIRSLHEAASLVRNSMRVSLVSSHRHSTEVCTRNGKRGVQYLGSIFGGSHYQEKELFNGSQRHHIHFLQILEPHLFFQITFNLSFFRHLLSSATTTTTTSVVLRRNSTTVPRFAAGHSSRLQRSSHVRPEVVFLQVRIAK